MSAEAHSSGNNRKAMSQTDIISFTVKLAASLNAEDTNTSVHIHAKLN